MEILPPPAGAGAAAAAARRNCSTCTARGGHQRCSERGYCLGVPDASCGGIEIDGSAGLLLRLLGKMRRDLTELIKEVLKRAWPVVREELKTLTKDLAKDLGKDVGKETGKLLIDELVRGLKELLEPVPGPLPSPSILIRKPGPLKVLVFDPLGGAAKNVIRSKELLRGCKTTLDITADLGFLTNNSSAPATTLDAVVLKEVNIESAMRNVMRSKELMYSSNKEVPSINAYFGSMIKPLVQPTNGEPSVLEKVVSSKVTVAAPSSGPASIAVEVPSSATISALPAPAVQHQAPAGAGEEASNSRVLVYFILAFNGVLLAVVAYRMFQRYYGGGRGGDDGQAATPEQSQSTDEPQAEATAETEDHILMATTESTDEPQAAGAAEAEDGDAVIDTTTKTNK